MTNVNPRDRTKCQQVYQDVQSEVYRGLQDLLRARTKDPFRDSFTRVVHKYLTGKQAPTFSIQELNSRL